jgi:hypothetical protein
LGAVDVYGLTADRKIMEKSTTWHGYGSPGAYPAFTALALGNTDRRGSVYAVVGFTETSPARGPTAPTVIGLDLATGAEKWRVPLPGVNSGGFTFYGPSPTAIEAMGRDASGAEFFAVVRSQANAVTPRPQASRSIWSTRTGLASGCHLSGASMASTM